jgi:hypothetical protein
MIREFAIRFHEQRGGAAHGCWIVSGSPHVMHGCQVVAYAPGAPRTSIEGGHSVVTRWHESAPRKAIAFAREDRVLKASRQIEDPLGIAHEGAVAAKGSTGFASVRGCG